MPESPVEPDPSAPLQRVLHRSWTGHLVKLLLLAVALYFTVRFAQKLPWRELGLRLTEAYPALLLLAIVTLFLRFASVVIRWSLALEEVGSPGANGSSGAIGPLWRRFFILLASVFLNHVTPSARILGGLLRARYQARYQKREFSTIYGTVLFDQVIQQSFTTLMTVLSTLAFTWMQHRMGWLTIEISILLVITLGVVLWLRHRHPSDEQPSIARIIRRKAQSQKARFKSLVLGTSEVVRTFAFLFKDKLLRTRMALLALAYVALTCSAQWLVFMALGIEISPLIVIVTISLGTAAGALSGSPGGIATTEAAMVGTYILLGVTEIDAAAATFLFRGLHYALVLSMGLPSLIYFELRHRA